MPLVELSPEAITKADSDGDENVANPERPTIYMAGPSPTHETELGPILEKIYERFYDKTDFVDPASIHDMGGGDSDVVSDVDGSEYWKSDGTFNERRWQRDTMRKKDDSFIIDVLRGDLDDALGFDGYAESFLDIATQSLDELIEFDIPTIIEPSLSPLPPTPFFEFDLLPIDINLFGGVIEFVKQMIFKSLGTVADAVLVARKADYNMVGASMEVKEAHENGLPVAVYDHSDKEDDNPLPMMLDQHADYVSNNPNWATSWLIDEVENNRSDTERIEQNPLSESNE